FDLVELIKNVWNLISSDANARIDNLNFHQGPAFAATKKDSSFFRVTNSVRNQIRQDSVHQEQISIYPQGCRHNIEGKIPGIGGARMSVCKPGKQVLKCDRLHFRDD